jgi:hypothetical protein
VTVSVMSELCPANGASGRRKKEGVVAERDAVVWRLRVAAIRYEVGWRLSRRGLLSWVLFPLNCIVVRRRATRMKREALTEIRAIARRLSGQKEDGGGNEDETA